MINFHQMITYILVTFNQFILKIYLIFSRTEKLNVDKLFRYFVLIYESTTEVRLPGLGQVEAEETG